jgi:hypothetical protein
MFEGIAAIFIFIAIIAITALLFGGWLIITIGRLVYRAIMWSIYGDEQPQPMAIPGINNAICPQANCRAANPARAAYCRRCGRAMPRAQRVTVRRAAMW